MTTLLAEVNGGQLSRGLYSRCEILRTNMGEGKWEVASCLAAGVDVRSRAP